MVETLINLKNNKLKKAAPGAHGGNEAKEQISKFVTGIGKKYQGSFFPLTVLRISDFPPPTTQCTHTSLSEYHSTICVKPTRKENGGSSEQLGAETRSLSGKARYPNLPRTTQRMLCCRSRRNKE